MVVHQPRRLHERIDDGRPHEAEAVTPQLAREGPGGIGLGGNLGHRGPPVLKRPIVDERPEPGVEWPQRIGQAQVGPGVADSGANLGAIAHDAGVRQQASRVGLLIRGHPRRVEAVESRPIAVALAQDCDPGEPGLCALEHEQLEETSIVMDRHAPLVVVIGEVQGVADGPVASVGHWALDATGKRQASTARLDSHVT